MFVSSYALLRKSPKSAYELLQKSPKSAYKLFGLFSLKVEVEVEVAECKKHVNVQSLIMRLVMNVLNILYQHLT